MIKKNQTYLNAVNIMLDWLMYAASLFISWYIRFNTNVFSQEIGAMSLNQYMFALIYIVPIYFLFYNVFGLYKPQRTKSRVDEFINIIKANLLGFFVFITILFIFKIVHYSRNVLWMFLIINILLNFCERLLYRTVLRRYRKLGFNIKYVIIVGNTELSKAYINRVLINKHWGYKILGFFDDNKICINKSIPFLGNIDKLEDYVKDRVIDEVVIALQLKEYSKLESVINICEKYGLYTKLIPDYMKLVPAKSQVENIDGLTLINLRDIPLKDNLNKAVKRLTDIVGSSIGIILFFIPMIIIALAIKLTSHGPIIFKQERVGLNRKKFNMYKFRSMTVQSSYSENTNWTTKHDSRVTRIGAFLRKTSLDEIPQFFNVLIGNMSLVGPRPEREHFVNQFTYQIPRYNVKHLVRPGITGWAQVNGYRGDTSIAKRIEHDIYYIENWSLAFDIKIIILTFVKGFINKNAY